MAKTDRRAQRTRELLQKALIELIAERGYDAITIQDIVDCANVGRTTFYQHYNSKDNLFVSCHEAIVGELHIGPLHPLSRRIAVVRSTSGNGFGLSASRSQPCAVVSHFSRPGQFLDPSANPRPERAGNRSDPA